MRVATIGDDGRIYDADGITFGRRAPPPPMLRNRGARRLRGLSSLADYGKSSLGQLPQSPPDKVGMAYLTAIKAATPASKFKVSRSESDPSSYVYPGRLIVSGDPAYTVQCKNFDGTPTACGTVFRFSTRPVNEGEVMLVALEGKAVGSYITVSEQEFLYGQLPDGTPKFYVVNQSNVDAVELNIVQPRPFSDGKFVTEQATGVFSSQLLQQSYFGLFTLKTASTAIEFSSIWREVKLNIVAAMALAQNGVDTAAMAYDFSAIGRKSFNIYLRVASDIIARSIELLEMMDHLVGTTDDRKVAEFYDKVIEIQNVSLYWAAILERASLFAINTSLILALISAHGQDMADAYSVYTLDGIRQNRDQVISSMVGKDEGNGQIITQERAAQLYDYSVKFLENAVSMNAQGNVQVNAEISDLLGGEITEDSIPEYIAIYSNMLRANAGNIVEIREQLRSKSIEVSSEVEGLGFTASVVAVMAAIPPVPGNAARSQRQLEIINSIKGKAYDQVNSGNLKSALNSIAKFVKGLAKPYEAIGQLSKVKGARSPERYEQERSTLQDQIKASLTPGDRQLLQQKLDDMSPEVGMLFKRASEETVAALDSASKRIAWTKDIGSDPKNAIEVLERELPKVAELIDQGLTYLEAGGGRKKLSMLLLKNEKSSEMANASDFKPGITLPLIKRFAKSYAEGGYLDDRVVSDLLRRDLKDGGVDPVEFANDLKQRSEKRKSDLLKGDATKRPVNPKDPKSTDKDVAQLELLASMVKKEGVTGSAQASEVHADVKNAVKAQEALPADQQAATTIEDYGRVKSVLEHANSLIRARDGTNKSTGGTLVELLLRIDENPTDAVIFSNKENAAVLDTAKAAISELKRTLTEVKDSLGNIGSFENLAKTHPKQVAIGRLLDKLLEAAKKAEEAAAPVQMLLRQTSWARTLKRATALRDKIWEKLAAANKWRQETIQKSIVGRVVYAVLGLPVVLTLTSQALYAAAVFVFGGKYTFASSPLGVVANIYGFAGSLLSGNEYADPGVSDPGGNPTNRGERGAGMSGLTKLVLLGLGVSLIASGGKVFGAVEKLVIGVTRVIEAAVKLVVPPKGKGQRGRPRKEGGGGGGGGHGRGRPPSLTKAEAELKRAIEKGDEEAVDKARQKVEKAKAFDF